MKTIIISVVISAAAVGIYGYFFGTPNYVSKARFEEAHTEVINIVDSIKADVILVKNKTIEIQSQLFRIEKNQQLNTLSLDSINSGLQLNTASLDSIKAGQKLLYNEVRKTNKGFSDKLFDYLKN